MEAKSFEDLPRYIAYQTVGKVFTYLPVIVKRENTGRGNAYFAMYARYYTRTGKMNPEQVLFWVCASTLNEVIENFIEEYNKNEQFIKDRIWYGDRAKIIDLTNCSIDGFFMPRNVNLPKYDL